MKKEAPECQQFEGEEAKALGGTDSCSHTRNEDEKTGWVGEKRGEGGRKGGVVMGVFLGWGWSWLGGRF